MKKEEVLKAINKLEGRDMNYGEALEVMKAGGNVSCKRWGTDGKVYVVVQKTNACYVLLLIDTNRNAMVSFTPSVENQLFDRWYIV